MFPPFDSESEELGQQRRDYILMRLSNKEHQKSRKRDKTAEKHGETERQEET
jgi:hypothetical protein